MSKKPIHPPQKFNDFTAVQSTEGHEFSGLAKGGMCETRFGRGWTVVVDQGFLGEDWVGPQILAHHLLLLCTADLYDPDYDGDQKKKGGKVSRNCEGKESLLNDKFFIGQQWRDKCVNDRLTASSIPLRACLHD